MNGDPQKRKVLYEALTKDGYALGTLDEFSTKMDDPNKARALYDGITKDGYEVGDFETFNAKVGSPKPAALSPMTTPLPGAAAGPSIGSGTQRASLPQRPPGMPELVRPDMPQASTPEQDAALDNIGGPPQEGQQIGGVSLIQQPKRGMRMTLPTYTIGQDLKVREVRKPSMAEDSFVRTQQRESERAKEAMAKEQAASEWRRQLDPTKEDDPQVRDRIMGEKQALDEQLSLANQYDPVAPDQRGVFAGYFEQPQPHDMGGYVFDQRDDKILKDYVQHLQMHGDGQYKTSTTLGALQAGRESAIDRFADYYKDALQTQTDALNGRVTRLYQMRERGADPQMLQQEAADIEAGYEFVQARMDDWVKNAPKSEVRKAIEQRQKETNEEYDRIKDDWFTPLYATKKGLHAAQLGWNEMLFGSAAGIARAFGDKENYDWSDDVSDYVDRATKMNESALPTEWQQPFSRTVKSPISGKETTKYNILPSLIRGGGGMAALMATGNLAAAGGRALGMALGRGVVGAAGGGANVALSEATMTGVGRASALAGELPGYGQNAGFTAGMFFPEYESYVRQAMDGGVPEKLASDAGLFYALGSAYIERLNPQLYVGGKKAFRTAFTRAIRDGKGPKAALGDGLRQIGIQGGKEGTEELMQGELMRKTNLAVNMLTGADLESASTLREKANEFGMGAILGSIAALPSNGVARQKRTLAEKESLAFAAEYPEFAADIIRRDVPEPQQKEFLTKLEKLNKMYVGNGLVDMPVVKADRIAQLISEKNDLEQKMKAAPLDPVVEAANGNPLKRRVNELTSEILKEIGMTREQAQAAKVAAGAEPLPEGTKAVTNPDGSVTLEKKPEAGEKKKAPTAKKEPTSKAVESVFSADEATGEEETTGVPTGVPEGVGAVTPEAAIEKMSATLADKNAGLRVEEGSATGVTYAETKDGPAAGYRQPVFVTNKGQVAERLQEVADRMKGSSAEEISVAQNAWVDAATAEEQHHIDQQSDGTMDGAEEKWNALPRKVRQATELLYDRNAFDHGSAKKTPRELWAEYDRMRRQVEAGSLMTEEALYGSSDPIANRLRQHFEPTTNEDQLAPKAPAAAQAEDTGAAPGVPVGERPATEPVATDLTEDLPDDPKVLADAYYDDHQIWNSNANPEYAMINAMKGRVKESSYDEWGDPNDKGQQMAKTYFAKKDARTMANQGQTLDQIAQELTEELGREVSPDELAELMRANQSGLPRTSPRMRQTADRYKAITGKRLTSAQGARSLKQKGKAAVKEQDAKDFIDQHTDQDGNVNWQGVKDNVHALGFLGYTDEQARNIEAEADRQLAANAGGGEVLEPIRAPEEDAGRSGEQGRTDAEEVADDVPDIPDEDLPISEPRTAEAAARKAAAILEKAKLKGDQLYALPLPPSVWNGAIRAMQEVIIAGGKAADAIAAAIKHIQDSDWWKNKATQKEKDEVTSHLKNKQDALEAAIAAEAKAEEPPPAPKAKSEPSGPKEVKKTFTTKRAYEGEFRDEVKAELAKGGLTREVENKEEARERGDAIIAKIGIDAALDAAKAGDVRGGARSAIIVRALEDIKRKMDTPGTTQEEMTRLAIEQSDLIQWHSQELTEAGREASMMDLLYQESDLGFTVAARTSDWKKKTGEEPSEEQIKRWKEVEAEMEVWKQKWAEAEKRAEEAEAAATMKALQEFVARQKSVNRKTTPAQRSKVLADKIRTLKIGQRGVMSATIVPPQVWDGAVEAVAQAMEATGKLATAIQAGLQKIRESDWYKKLRKDEQEDSEASFTSAVNEAMADDVESGPIRIPKQMIREAVANGAKDIDALVATIKEQLTETYPDATDRQIRDAITEYGKVVNLNKDELSAEVRRIKRIGRIVSALEDVANQKRPLRSGLQRDKLDAEERALNKELREAMKDLPVDAEAQARELRTALDAAKTRARNRIEDLQREIDTRQRTPRSTTRIEPDAELEALIAEKEELEKEHDAIFGDKSLTEEERLKRVIDATRRSVEALEQKVRDKNVDPAKPQSVPETPELKALRQRREKLREEYRRLQEEAGVITRRKLDTAKKAAKARIQELERRIDQGDFSKKEAKPPVTDNELIRLQAEKMRLKEEYDKEFYKHKLLNRTMPERAKDAAWEFWGLTRALRATGELSFVLMQGGALTVSNLWHKPGAVGRAFKTMWQAMRSEKKSEEWLRKVKSQDWYPMAKEAKLAITEPHAELSAREELFMSDWTKIIWNVLGSPLKLASKKAYEVWAAANPMRAIERGASGYLDTLRIERFMDGMEMIRKNTGAPPSKEELKDIADVANTLTGRASIGKLEPIANTLTKLFFSPRLWASAIKTGTPYAFIHFGKMTPTARKMAVQDLGRYLGTTMGLVALAATYFNNDDDDETGVETDPRSADFGKIKIGNKYIDPWGGRIQQLVFSTRMTIGLMSLLKDEPLDAYKDRKTGEATPLGQGMTPTMMETAMRMAQNKLAPSAGIIAEAMGTKVRKDGTRTSFGKEYGLSDELVGSLYPIYWETVKDLAKEDPGALEGFLMFYAFFGGGVNVDEPKAAAGRQERVRPERPEPPEPKER